MTENAQDADFIAGSHRSIRAPWISCSLTTLAAIPIWFVGLIAIVDLIKPIDNPAGIPVYMMMCLVASAVIVPLNSFGIGPIIAKLGFPSTVRSVGVHLILSFVVFGILWNWPSTIGQYPSLAWTIIPFYTSTFLLPPILIGSLVYSLRYNAINGDVWTNNAIHRSRGWAVS